MTDEIRTFEYTITDVIEVEPFDICRLWKFTIRDDLYSDIRQTEVEVFVSHDVSAAYESNMDTDGGRPVEVSQVPKEVRTELADRLQRDVKHIRQSVPNPEFMIEEGSDD